MPRLVPVSASDGTLWNVALRYLGDPLQAGRIAALNGLSDFWLFNFTVPTDLIIPDADATLTGYAPPLPGTDFRTLLGLVQPGVPVPVVPIQTGTSATALAIISIASTFAGVPFTVSLGYAGPLQSLDYQIDGGAWMQATSTIIQNGGAIFSVPGATVGSHSIVVRDSFTNTVATPAFSFVITAASGNPIPDGVAYDPDNDFGGDIEDMVSEAAVPAALGDFILGINCLAPDPVAGRTATSDISPDWEALGVKQ